MGEAREEIAAFGRERVERIDAVCLRRAGGRASAARLRGRVGRVAGKAAFSQVSAEMTRCAQRSRPRAVHGR